MITDKPVLLCILQNNFYGGWFCTVRSMPQSMTLSFLSLVAKQHVKDCNFNCWLCNLWFSGKLYHKSQIKIL